MADSETIEAPARKEHWRTKQAREKREAEDAAVLAESARRQVGASPVMERAQAEAAAANAANDEGDDVDRSDEVRAAEIAASLRGPDPAMASRERAPIVLNPDPSATTIEGRIGLPPRPTDTPIHPTMTQDDIDMLTAKALRFISPKATPRVRSTTFENQIRAVPHRAEPATVTLGAPVQAPIEMKFGAVGGLMDFGEFINRRFTMMGKETVDAVMTSSTADGPYAVMRKLYVAYVYCFHHAKEAERCAAIGKLD